MLFGELGILEKNLASIPPHASFGFQTLLFAFTQLAQRFLISPEMLKIIGACIAFSPQPRFHSLKISGSQLIRVNGGPHLKSNLGWDEDFEGFFERKEQIRTGDFIF